MDETLDFEDLIVQAVNQISKFIIPLYVENRNKLELLGTGFFLNHQGRTSLITASHVLSKVSDTSPLFTFRHHDEILQLGGNRYLSDPAGIDLGFLIVQDLELPWRALEKFPCHLDYLMSQRAPRASKHYVVSGFPETKNRQKPGTKNIIAQTYSYCSDSIPDHEYHSHGLNPLDHVALPLDLRKGFNPDGEVVTFPKPLGMSGSPIWELYDELPNTSQPRVFPLVAVATTYKKKILYGTDVSHLLSRLLVAS